MGIVESPRSILGLPRWSEDPTHILGALSNYLHLKDANLAPEVQFQRERKRLKTCSPNWSREQGTRAGCAVGLFTSS